MTIPRFAIVAVALAAMTAPALAQEQTSPPSPTHQAANAREQPVTEALNNQVQRRLIYQQEITAELQGQYEIDRLQYREAVKDRVAKIGTDKARYMLQEENYARAMIAWRMQVEACKQGKVKECNDPSPNPADFY